MKDGPHLSWSCSGRRISASLFACAVLFLLGFPRHAALAQAVPEPSGYRMDPYRAPVPATLAGARVVDTAEARRLWEQRAALFVDVMPDAPKPANLPKGTVWRDKPRNDIPGSTWLANVGYGAINAETEAYFRKGLSENGATQKSSPILFYCMTNCWMSWNAAKRAVEWGYTSVIWYPDGADGWEKSGLPLEDKRPFIAKD